MFFKYLLPALSAGSAYLQDFSEEAVAAKCTPFQALIVKNDGFCLLEVSINGKVVDNINSKGAKVFSTAIYSFGVKNKENIPTLADTVKAYVMNTEAIQTTDEGTILAHDIDKELTVTDNEQPLVTTSDAQRFADWYEIYVKSYGVLTPGEHKIYFGSGALTKEFVNVYSKYTFPEKSGKHWDLNEMKIKCDDAFRYSNLIANGNSDTIKPTFNGLSADYFCTSSLSADIAPKVGAKCLKITAQGGQPAWGYLLGNTVSPNKNGLDVGRFYEASCWVYIPSTSNINYWQLNLQIAGAAFTSNTPLGYDAWYPLNLNFTMPDVPLAYVQIIAWAGVDAGKSFYVDDLVLRKHMIASEYPKINISGAC